MDTQILSDIQQVNHLREQKDYQGSIDLAHMIINNPVTPLNVTIHAHLSACIAYKMLQKYKEAKQEALLADSKNTDPQNKHFIYFELGGVAHMAKSFSEAANYYQKSYEFPIDSKDDNGLRDRYLAHWGFSLALSGDSTGLEKLQQATTSLESRLASPEMSKETGEYDHKYNLQVWLSKTYMDTLELNPRDTLLPQKIDTLLLSNPLLKVRSHQWQELKSHLSSAAPVA